MTAPIPEGFRRLDVTDDFVSLVGPLWFKAEEDGLQDRAAAGAAARQSDGRAHGGLLVTSPTW